jgi:hypothetical protein
VGLSVPEFAEGFNEVWAGFGVGLAEFNTSGKLLVEAESVAASWAAVVSGVAGGALAVTAGRVSAGFVVFSAKAT